MSSQAFNSLLEDQKPSAHEPKETYTQMKLRIQREENELNALKRQDRMAEADIKTRELDLKERDVNLKDRELDIKEREQTLKRKRVDDLFETMDEAFKRYEKVRAYDSDNDTSDHGTAESNLAFKYRDIIETF